MHSGDFENLILLLEARVMLLNLGFRILFSAESLYQGKGFDTVST